MKKNSKPPVILNKADAYAFAAVQLRDMLNSYRLVQMIDGVIKESGRPLDGEAAEKMRQLDAELPHLDVQIVAIEQAAVELERMALEERLMAAKPQADFRERMKGQ